MKNNNKNEGVQLTLEVVVKPISTKWDIDETLKTAINNAIQNVKKTDEFVAIPFDVFKEHTTAPIKTENVRSVAQQLKRKYPNWRVSYKQNPAQVLVRPKKL